MATTFDHKTSPNEVATVPKPRTRPRILPGFGISLGFTVSYLGLIILIPLSLVFVKSAGLGFSGLFQTLSSPRIWSAVKLTFGASALAALINSVLGSLVAWVLVRYRFPFRRFFDASVDLPFAMPTAVAGIALTALWVPTGWLGQYAERFGIKVAFTPLGVLLALTFIGLPFVVRTLQPVLEELDPAQEEAAASLGASRLKIFLRVTLPQILPPLITGTTLAFARALGEYGSVVFISGNLPGKTEILPLLIMTKLEQYEYAAANAIAALTLVLSFVLLLIINLLQRWSSKGRRSA